MNLLIVFHSPFKSQRVKHQVLKGPFLVNDVVRFTILSKPVDEQ